jgi:hypothetical protein
MATSERNVSGREMVLFYIREIVGGLIEGNFKGGNLDCIFVLGHSSEET